MKYLIILILTGVLLNCSSKAQKKEPANVQTKLFCDNIRHFESFYSCRIGHEIGWDDQPSCPMLWDLYPELSPEKLPESQALKVAIERDCKKPSADCNVTKKTCTEEQKAEKKKILDCVYNKVQSFKKTKCPHL